MKSLLFSIVLLISLPLWAAETITAKIKGMHCGGCSAKITSELKKLPEVADTTVNLKTKKAVITLKEGAKLSAAKIEETIVAAGYEVSR